MRPSQKQNRSRGKSNRKNVGNNINRVYESAGPDGKVRGTPQQIIDKYNALARDAQTSGDRVTAENFLQHAEHYLRLLIAAQTALNERREQSNGAQYRGSQTDEDGGDSDETQDDIDETEVAPAEVNGMATFDGAEEPSELVETPETGRKKSGRGRRPRASAQANPPEATGGEAAPAQDGASETVS